MANAAASRAWLGMSVCVGDSLTAAIGGYLSGPQVCPEPLRGRRRSLTISPLQSKGGYKEELNPAVS
jgi:hypothetical protein